MVVLVNRFSAIGWWLAVLVLTGCQAQAPFPPGAAKPTAKMLNLRVQDAQLDYATLRFEIEVCNPLGTEVSVEGLRYGLTSGPNMFFSATPVPASKIPTQTTRHISFTHQVVYERLLRALGAKPESTVPFTMESRLLVRSHRRMAQVPLRSEGSLFLPPTSPGETGGDGSRPVDVIYIATPQDVVEKMLSVADVKKDDLVYDLGCGDGRIVVTAAEAYGCRAVGFDIDPRRVKESRDRVQQKNLEHLVQIEQKDLFTVDLTPANVVAFYLNPVVNRRLIPQLQTLQPGSRIVSHSFPVGDIKPDQIVTMTSREDGQEHCIYLYRTPLQGE